MMMAVTGCVIRPTRRSVTARHRNNSFVGGRREDTLRKAIRIKMLPRDVLMDRKTFKALKAKKITAIPSGNVNANVLDWTEVLV